MTSHTGRLPKDPMPWAVMFAGFCASMIGIGLARFAYTPLIPELISAGWFSETQVIYLGAANLGGYLLGALLARPLGRRLGNVRCLRTMMMLTALTFFACAWPLSLSWFFLWRLLSGITGGVIMVLVAATLMPCIPLSRRGLAGGAIFLGLGLGIAASGTLVPLLQLWGLRVTWTGLGLLAALLMLLSWPCWPRGVKSRLEPEDETEPSSGGLPLKILYMQYGLMAIGVVPAMVFLVDFIARGLHLGPHTGSVFWVIYGAGAMVGPMIYGHMADRLGAGRALRLILPVQAMLMIVVLVDQHPLILGLTTFAFGSFPGGGVPLVLHRIHQILPGDHDAQAAVWSRATVVFACFQALAGYGYSYLFSLSGGNYFALFAVGAGALFIAFLADMVNVFACRNSPESDCLSESGNS